MTGPGSRFTREIPRFVIVVAVVTGTLAFLGGLVTAIAPLIGLGEKEEFLLFRYAEIARADAAVWFLQTLLISILVGGFSYGVARARFGVNFVQNMGEVSTLSGRLLGWFGGLYLTARTRLDRTSRGIDWVWSWLNRDWAVTLLLTPFALYILVFWIVAFPDAPWLAPDSQGYLVFFPLRTLFYPLFLRVVAAISSDPNLLVAIQLLTGISGTIFLAEVTQRVVRNVWVTLPAGIFLLFNWPILEHAFILLTDYLFYGVVCFQFGAVIQAVRKCTTGRVLFVMATTALAIAIRPAGIFLLAALPFLLIVWPRYWRSLVNALAVPLVVLFGLQMGANKALYGYFGLSLTFGYSTLSNALLVLKPDAPFPHPELIKELYDKALPYQQALESEPNFRLRVLNSTNLSNELILDGSRIVKAYAAEHGLVTLVDESRRRRFVAWLDDTSPLNRDYKRLGIGLAPNWVWLDGFLGRLAVASAAHNFGGFMKMTWEKFIVGWDWVIPSFQINTRFPPRHQLLQRHLPRIGFDTQYPPDATPSPEWTSLARGFKFVANGLRQLGLVVPLPVVVALAGAAMLTAFAWFAVRRENIPVTVSVLAYLAGCVLALHMEIALGSIPLPRLFSPVTSAAMVLLFSPFLLFSGASRQRFNALFASPGLNS